MYRRQEYIRRTVGDKQTLLAGEKRKKRILSFKVDFNKAVDFKNWEDLDSILA